MARLTAMFFLCFGHLLPALPDPCIIVTDNAYRDALSLLTIAEGSMNVKILIVDDHELIINGIKNMLAPYKRYQVVGQTENGLDVYNLCVQTEPDMVILDLGLPGMNGQ
ncbi:response regulator, partial [Candidatus Williamhamiltonella defendens]|uniref:response regulator n=1 Tax=Candidatus Williamhamiltonella defendens TaxID=138072 RepID=UPI0020C6DBF9